MTVLRSSRSARGCAVLPQGVASRPIRLPRRCRRDVFTATGLSASARAAIRALLRAAISVSTASAACSPANRGSAASLEWAGRRSVAGIGPECPPIQPIARAPVESVAAARTTGEAAAIRPTPGIARDSTVIRKSPIRIGPLLRPGDSNQSGSVESDWWSVAAEVMWLNVARTYRTASASRRYLRTPCRTTMFSFPNAHQPKRSQPKDEREPNYAQPNKLTAPAEKATDGRRNSSLGAGFLSFLAFQAEPPRAPHPKRVPLRLTRSREGPG